MLRARDPKQVIDEIYGKLGRKKGQGQRAIALPLGYPPSALRPYLFR